MKHMFETDKSSYLMVETDCTNGSCDTLYIKSGFHALSTKQINVCTMKIVCIYIYTYLLCPV